MNKLAFGDIWNAIQPSVLPGLMGAGLGAGSMAAFGPEGEDNAEDPNGKKHQMLKNLALGASLGGLVGAGGGQAWDFAHKVQPSPMNLVQRGALMGSDLAQSPSAMMMGGGVATGVRSQLERGAIKDLKTPTNFDYRGAVQGIPDAKAVATHAAAVAAARESADRAAAAVRAGKPPGSVSPMPAPMPQLPPSIDNKTITGLKGNQSSWLEDMMNKTMGKPTLNRAGKVISHFHIPDQEFNPLNPDQKAVASKLRDEMLGNYKDVSPGRLPERLLQGPVGGTGNNTTYSWKNWRNALPTGNGVKGAITSPFAKFKGPTYGELVRRAPENLPFYIKNPTLTRVGRNVPLAGLAALLAGKVLPPIDNVIGGDALQRLKESQGWRPGM